MNYEKEIQKFEEFLNEKSESLQEVYWEKTLDKYSKNLELSKHIIANLQNEEYFSEFIELFEDTNSSIDKYVESCQNPEYQIAIVGAIKAGKSTLINSLIGYELASVDVTPETATLTKFKYSEKINTLKVKFYSSNEWEKIWHDAESKQAEVFLEEYEKLKSEEVKETYLDKNEIIIEFLNVEDLKNEIKKWTSSKKQQHYFVKEIEIGLMNLKLPNQVCLVDTPGLNDVVEYRSNITLDYIDRANAVIICVNAKTLRNEEMLTITKVFSQARHKKDKIYVLGTQIDTMNSINDWKKQKEEWVKYLKSEVCFESELKAKRHLIGISSYLYSNANKQPITIDILDEIATSLKNIKYISRSEYKELDKVFDLEDYSHPKIIELKKKVNEISHIEEVKSIIEDEMINEFKNTLINDFVEKYKLLKTKVNEISNSHSTSIENYLKELDMSNDEIEQQLKIKTEKLKEFDKSITQLKSNVENVRSSFNMDFSKLKEGFSELTKGLKNIEID